MSVRSYDLPQIMLSENWHLPSYFYLKCFATQNELKECKFHFLFFPYNKNALWIIKGPFITLKAKNVYTYVKEKKS